MQLAQAADQLDAAAILEPQVDHGIFGLDAVGEVDPGLEALGGIDLEAATLEGTLQATAQGRVVVDQDEDRGVARGPVADGQWDRRWPVRDVLHRGSAPRRPGSCAASAS